MKVIIVYESMFGNTHLIAESIAAGLVSADARVVPVGQATREVLAGADLVVVGGPTHVHGMSRDSTRASAVTMATKPGQEVDLDPDAEGPGLRDWFDALGANVRWAAAFDTRAKGSTVLTGQASKGISKRLRKHGFEEILAPCSFFVTKENHLQSGEADRARQWGEQLLAALKEGLQVGV
ncbi:flavodoxin family protein [Ilumatobacter sp.]|uniref:flavodoxin family protein n=1 Tax=Ilumatobacter sp. TaxID=1967498 RepID=UPI003751D2A3